ncbi:MAG: SpoIIE family protein phosphatase [Spirochaetales bacterium]|nr:SpoIIE family protein phosphatase [Spirochaetales bacterium]
MQTALLDSYAMLPLAASLLVQGVVGLFLFRIAKHSHERAPEAISFKLPAISIAVLCLFTLATLVFPSLLVLSSGILLSSIFIAIFLIVLSLTLPAQQEQPELVQPIPDSDSIQEEETETEDPLVATGQQFISRLSETLTGEVNIVRLLDYINDTLIEQTHADGGIVFLADDFEDSIAAKSFKGSFPPPYKLPQDLPHKPVRVETNFRYCQFNLGDNIFGEVAASGKPVLIESGTMDDRIFVNGPEEFLKPGSYIVVPLMVKDRVVGVAGLARLPENAPFNGQEFRIAEVLSEYAGASINNVYNVQEILEHADLEREASIASKIQKTLQPKRLPELPEVGFGSLFNATKGVCGDYYDVILARRDRIVVTIADVAGKGIQSSMVMIMLRSILHLVTNTTKSAATVLDWVNKGITGKIDMDHYATLSYLSYCPENHTIEYASAGHQPLLVWRSQTKTMETIRQKTDPIGVERGSVYADMKLTVAKGDIIILYTDGLVEALNTTGQQYGLENLTRVLSESSSMTAKDLAAEVKHNIQAFVGSASLHDDQTLVIMKIKA